MNNVQKCVEEIYRGSSQSDILESGLFDGKTGILLSKLHYEYCNNIKFDNMQVAAEIESIIVALANANYINTSYATGISGLFPLFSLLIKNDLIGVDEDTSSIISHLQSIISESITHDIKNHNIDLMYGSLGKVSGLLESPIPAINSTIELLTYIHNAATVNEGGLYSLFFRDGYGSRDYKHVNIGMAHGILGIVQLCIKARKINGCAQMCSDIVAEISCLLLKSVQIDNEESAFPYILINGIPTTHVSRLGWCYGDLIIGYIILLSSSVFENSTANEMAIAILLKCCDRKDLLGNGIYDAGICHGSAGIGHIFHRAWKYTNDPHFYTSAKYWIEKTLELVQPENGIFEFKRHNPDDNLYYSDYSLLEGMAGIGLVLSSWESGDCSWDSCLMLQDNT